MGEIPEEAQTAAAGALFEYFERIRLASADQRLTVWDEASNKWPNAACAAITAALPHLYAALAEGGDAEKRNSANLERTLVEVSDENERLLAEIDRLEAGREVERTMIRNAGAEISGLMMQNVTLRGPKISDEAVEAERGEEK